MGSTPTSLMRHDYPVNALTGRSIPHHRRTCNEEIKRTLHMRLTSALDIKELLATFRKASYSSFWRPTYLGLGTSMTRTFSSFPLTMCMNWSRRLEGGFVVYVKKASSKLMHSVWGWWWFPKAKRPWKHIETLRRTVRTARFPNEERFQAMTKRFHFTAIRVYAAPLIALCLRTCEALVNT